jgi:hypothetical protein
MLITQFLSPSHFLLGYLEDYKMDPNAATPLLTFSVFNDYADSGDISLVRCDIINRGIQDDEGRKVVQSVSQIVASVLETAGAQRCTVVYRYPPLADSFDLLRCFL